MELTNDEVHAIIEEGHMEMAYAQLEAMDPVAREKLLNSVEFGEPEDDEEYIDYSECPWTKEEAEALGYQIDGWGD